MKTTQEIQDMKENRLKQAEELLKICVPQLPDETAVEVQEFLDNEQPEPKLPEGLQKYIDGVALNILYSNYHKTTYGTWSRADVDEHLDDGHGEYYVVNVDFGCQDDTRNEQYRDTIYVYHNGTEWRVNRTIPAQRDEDPADKDDRLYHEEQDHIAMEKAKETK